MRPVNLNSDNNGGFGITKALNNAAGKFANKVTSVASSVDTRSFFYSFFITIDEINKLYIWNSLFYLFQSTPLILQIIALHLWIPSNGQNHGKYFKIFSKLNWFLTFSSDTSTNVFSLISVLFIMGGYLAMGVFLLLSILGYKNKGHIPKFNVYMNACLYEIGIYFFYLPMFNQLGTTFSGIQKSDSTSTTVFFLMLMLIIGVSYLLSITVQTVNFLTTPSKDSFSTLNGKHVFLLMMLNGSLVACSHLPAFFDEWFTTFLYVISLIIHIYIMYDASQFNYSTLGANSLTEALLSIIISFDILTIIKSFYKYDDIFELVVPVLSFVIVFIIFNSKFTKMAAKLREVLAQNIDMDINDLCAQLSITSEEDAHKLLRLGLIELIPSVLNGEFPIKIAEKFNTFGSWVLSAQITVFLPGEHEAFSQCVNSLKSLYTRTTVEKMQLLRLIRLERLRFLSQDNEKAEQIMRIKADTLESIAAVKRFWSNMSSRPQSIELSDVNNIAGIVLDMKQKWVEILGSYPNESVIASEYSSFLIECLGKFEKGVFWQLKSGHLKSGLRAGIDDLFRAFVVSRPRLLKDKIIDKMGCVIKVSIIDGENGTTATTTTTFSTNAEEKLAEDIEAGMIEKTSGELFMWPRLRNFVTKITSHFLPGKYNVFSGLKYFGITVSLILIVYIGIFFSKSLDMCSISNKQIEKVVEMGSSVSMVRTFVLMQWAAVKGVLFNSTTLGTYLPLTALSETGTALNFLNMSQSVTYWTQNCIDQYVSYFEEVSLAGSNGYNISRMVQMMIDPSLEKTHCVNGEPIDSHAKLSPKNAIVNSLWNQYKLDIPAYVVLGNSSTYCEVTLLQDILAEGLKSIINDISSQNVEYSDYIKEESQKLISIFLVLQLFVLSPCVLSPLISIVISTNKLFSSLKKVNSAGAMEASNPIRIGSQEKNHNSSVHKTSNSFSRIVTLYTLIASICLVITVLLPYYAFSISSQASVDVSSLIELSLHGSTRQTHVLNMISIVSFIIMSQKYSGGFLNASKAVQTSYNITVSDLKSSNLKFLHGSGNDGIYSKSDSIKNLHVKDKCQASSGGSMHSFYSCLGLERALSTFILLSDTIVNGYKTGIDFQTNEYVNLLHFGTAELYVLLKESRTLMDQLILDKINSDVKTVYILIICSIAMVIAMFSAFSFLESAMKRTMKAILVLIRHLPPPVLAETTDIISALSLKNNSVEKLSNDPLDVVFNNVSTPILCIGENNVIEAANKPFLSIFHISSGEVVGRRLNSIVPVPNVGEGQMSIEEQGGLRLFEKMELMKDGLYEFDHCHYLVNLQCSDGVPIPVQATCYSFQGRRNKNFVIFFEDTRELTSVQEELEQTERQVEALSAQLIPRAVSRFITGRERGFAFMSASSTVVAIRVPSIIDTAPGSLESVDKIFSQLDSLANKHHPMMPHKTIGDIAFFIGGLFNNDDPSEHAVAGINYALEAKSILNNLISKDKVKERFFVSVLTGGPLLCGLVGSTQLTFEISGSLIDDAADLAEFAPIDTIIVSQATREAIKDAKIAFTHQGIPFRGNTTYLF